MADRFYTNCELSPGEVILAGDESHHLATVLRARPGDAVRLFNGDGHEYPARVVSVAKREAVLEVLAVERIDRELDFRLTIASALPKGDRADFLAEKLTEIGVSQWVPLRTERSVVHPHGAKLDRLRRAVIEASKQCRRNVLMGIAPLTEFAEILGTGGERLIAHPGGSPLGPARGDVTVAVGPEGGFTDSEVEQAESAGWRVVDLGPRILRVETAALVAASRVSAPGTT